MDVTVCSTGGTIASTDAAGGATPTRTGAQLIEAVPELEEYATLTVEGVAQTPSYEMDADTLETIGDRVRELDDDPTVDAVVVTHGTDTLEETAYYLDVTVQPDTPVFLTGAQRRPDEVSPGGPSNLLTAVRAGREFVERARGFRSDNYGTRSRSNEHTGLLHPPQPTHSLRSRLAPLALPRRVAPRSARSSLTQFCRPSSLAFGRSTARATAGGGRTEVIRSSLVRTTKFHVRV